MESYELLDAIRKVQFAAIELNFYLDNFPNNKEATEDYKKLSDKLNTLICKYEKDYGPLTNFGSAYVENPKAWTDQPWPWENC